MYDTGAQLKYKAISNGLPNKPLQKQDQQARQTCRIDEILSFSGHA